MTAASPPSKSHSVTSISKNSPIHDALKSRDPLDFFGGNVGVWGAVVWTRYWERKVTSGSVCLRRRSVLTPWVFTPWRVWVQLVSSRRVEGSGGVQAASQECLSLSACVRTGPGCGAAGAGRRGGGGDGVYAAAASDASLPSKKITFSPFINWPKNTVPLGRPLGASWRPRQTVSVAATTAQLQFQLQLILPLAWRDRRGEKKWLSIICVLPLMYPLGWIRDVK